MIGVVTITFGNYMKWILTLLCFLCLHDPLVAKITGSHLRALIISDKAPRSMKNSYLHDAYRMKQMLQAIARYTKCPLQLQMCAGKKSSFRTLKKWLRSLPLSSKDIVFVYYAGKGCPQVGNNLWPSIKFPDRHGCFGRTYTEGEIASQISAKHPRLTLVFFDCYDQLIKIRRPSRSFSAEKLRFRIRVSLQRYRKSFETHCPPVLTMSWVDCTICPMTRNGKSERKTEDLLKLREAALELGIKASHDQAVDL